MFLLTVNRESDDICVLQRFTRSCYSLCLITSNCGWLAPREIKLKSLENQDRYSFADFCSSGQTSCNNYIFLC